MHGVVRLVQGYSAGGELTGFLPKWSLILAQNIAKANPVSRE